MKRTHANEDLSVLGRRGELGAGELRRLDMMLGASHLERWIHETGQEFDRMDPSVEGDAALLERAIDRASAPRAPASRKRRGVMLATAAVAGLVTIAAAAVTLPRWLAPRPSPSMPNARGVHTADTPRPAPVSRPADLDVGPAATASSAPGNSAASAAARSEEHAAVSARPANAASAAQLFAEANTLRKAGQLPQAIAAYRRLGRAHPGSPQAALSHLLLGRILLQQGSAGAAYAEFTSYLRSGADGTLAEDALYGQAAALRMSGRTAEERRVHEQLIARFPNSVHAAASRARLLELNR